MYERFTDRARKAMQLSQQEARRLNHEHVGTEHILLGLVAEGTGVAINVLRNLGVRLQRIRFGVESLAPHNAEIRLPGIEPKTSRVTNVLRSVMGIGSQSTRLAQTPHAKKVIEYAMEEARQFNHKYVGTEHLLLGLLQEHEGVAAQTLRNFGVQLHVVRDTISNSRKTQNNS